MKNNEKNPLFAEQEQETAENITIEINEPKHNFIIVYDTIYRNNDLSATEKGLLLNLLSMAPTFKPNKNGLMKISKLGKTTYYKTIADLQAKGYLKIERKGRCEYKYIVNQAPTLTDKQLTYEYLSIKEQFNVPLWNSLLNTKKITYETYKQLWENLQKIVKTNYLK